MTACYRYNNGKLEVLDQLLLPLKTEYIVVSNSTDGYNVIKNMQVRGAPAISIVGCLSLVEEIRDKKFPPEVFIFNQYVCEKLDYLVSARPTAANMLLAKDRLVDIIGDLELRKEPLEVVKAKFIEEVEAFVKEDEEKCQIMAHHAANTICSANLNTDRLNILTHCNTGSLATGGCGTALGAVRQLHKEERLGCCYYTETRPYLQGARLTAYELKQEYIPSRLLPDSAVAALMSTTEIHAVVVGADRIVANGDTANKIGTYQLALIAKHHEVPFYVVAPLTSADLSKESGADIVIEQRHPDELTQIAGHRFAPKAIEVWNPAFDVTPTELITGGIVTELGVFPAKDFKEHVREAFQRERFAVRVAKHYEKMAQENP